MSQNKPETFVPQPMPENLWGERWQFVRLTVEDLEHRLLLHPIPIRRVSPAALPSQQALTADALIPGIVLEAGKRSLTLSRWIEQQQPTSVAAVNRELGAVMLDSASHRWILATYQDQAVQEAAKNFEDLKLHSSGIHFLLIQPDDSGTTHSGLWILRENA